MAAIWGPVKFGGMVAAVPGNGGVGKWWCVYWRGHGIFCWGEYCTQVAMCTTAQGAWYSGEIVF